MQGLTMKKMTGAARALVVASVMGLCAVGAHAQQPAPAPAPAATPAPAAAPAAPPAAARQPLSVNPEAAGVKEDQLFKALKPEFGGTAAIEGRGSIPDKKSYRIEQPAGRDWNEFRSGTLTKVGGGSILGVLALLCFFYLLRGRVMITGGRSGQLLERFGSVERFAHWLSATSFVVLALSGLNITFGRALLLPLIGPDAFTAITQLGKFAHNYVSFAFALGITLMFLVWVKDNLPSLRDIRWIAQGGGLVGLGHPPADRFNAGQKIIFWTVVLGGIALSITGYILMFPFVWTDIGGQQAANMIHALAGVVMVAVIIAHIYIGSVGMEGAFEAMGSGKVDLNWAREHHSIWVDKVLARKRDKVTPAE
jgi:formate dehydrogenase subunit gamma